MKSTRDEILQTCLVPFEGPHASGVASNNKLDFERLRMNPDVYWRFVAEASWRAREYRKLVSCEKTIIVPVPDGANVLGGHIARSVGLCCLKLRRGGQPGDIEFGSGARETLEKSDHVILFEDVTTTRGSLQRMLDIDQIGEKAKAVIVGWERGNPSERLSLGDIPLRAVVDEYVPFDLEADDERWAVAHENRRI
ncbi:MAG TPA: phosphoribosyltransferase [Candidatus Saccharimonadales bacterium]|jgi:hypothetical protein